MRTGRRLAAVAAAILACASVARAHELACEKLVKLAGTEGPGTPLLQIETYPAQVTYTWIVFNVNPTETSVLTSVSDTLFAPTSETVDVAIPVGQAITESKTVTVQSFEDCARFATSQEANGAVDVDNRLTATWDFGEAQCTARLVCVPPTPPPPRVTCEKTVDDKGLEEIRSYPTTLHYAVTIENEGGSDASITSASDSLFTALGFTPAPPFTLAAGATKTATMDLDVASYDACRAMATSCTCGETTAPPVNGTCAEGCVANVDNVFTVGWDSHAATCSAGVKCFPPSEVPPELTCTKTIDDTDTVTIATYPSTVTYDVTITNTSATAATVTGASDPALTLSVPSTPFQLAAGASVSGTGTLTVGSFADCQELATSMAAGNAIFDNTFTVTWDTKTATCTARLVCVPPPPGQATRTMGFFKTHEVAAQECIDASPGGVIDIGLAAFPISDLEEFMALLWASPAQFTGDIKLRFLLARQTLVADCNQLLFGTSSNGLVETAIEALATCSTDLSALISEVDAFNESGDEFPFPAGFVPGPATPRDAEALVTEPLTAADLACTP